jgi:hypothetical protein
MKRFSAQQTYGIFNAEENTIQAEDFFNNEKMA